MATAQYTVKQISRAIEILNRKRQPLLRKINSNNFHIINAQDWAVEAQLRGLNIVTHDLEETRARYLQA